MTIFLIWIHLLAAISWIGGMIFLSLVLAPLVRSQNAAPEFMALFRSAALRFRLVVWSAAAVLLATGPMLLHQRGLHILDLSQWPRVLRIKIGLVVVLLVLTVTHDLLLGPQIRKISAIPDSARTSWEQVLAQSSAWVPRLALILALGVLFSAVILARS
ncbi:MAG: hypothetical protein EWM72_00639 [Nitrospira sp.]|nr:MAG: hypothetical protein EWM72_00639 [Nitrospira sp.]